MTAVCTLGATDAKSSGLSADTTGWQNQDTSGNTGGRLHLTSNSCWPYNLITLSPCGFDQQTACCPCVAKSGRLILVSVCLVVYRVILDCVDSSPVVV